MRDYRLALLQNDDTAYFCFRALESIRQAFVAQADGNDTRPSWQKMSTTLRLSKHWATEVAGLATQQRHGDPSTYVTAMQRRKWIEQIRTAIDRFMAYVGGGSAPLDVVKYPLL